MKKLITSILLSTSLVGCSNSLVTQKDTDVFVVSNDTILIGRYNRTMTSVQLSIPNREELMIIDGTPNCLKTHDVIVGNTYKIKLKYDVNGRVRDIKELCLLTALIKQGEETK